MRARAESRGGQGTLARRLPVGAEPVPGGAHFRVWAPAAQRVEVVGEAPGASGSELERDRHGYFSGFVPGVKVGDRYRYRLDGDASFPDPATRFQPDGPHGASQLVDPSSFAWTDDGWPGLSPERQVVYELHVGTFTEAGTWAAASGELVRLKELGITAVELLPVAEFSGRFGWGYDGVAIYAPTRLYGAPDDLRRFVDRAHAVGLGVLLDVVYNHCGPDGCYLRAFSPAYFSSRYAGEWGDPLNFDGEGAGPVRELVVENAAYWISEFHVDGLRLDATQSVFDASPRHVLAELSVRVREAAGSRRVLLVAENEPQDTRTVRPVADGGYGLDLLWNDDLHHAAYVAATGRREAYYTDYRGTPQELVSAAKHGYLFQGQRYAWQGKRRGTATRGLPRHTFVAYLENHDQVANSADGARLHQLTSPGRHRALTALLLLGPWTPMLFQGQEFGSSRPFLYFADQPGPIAAAVRAGRAEFLAQFPGIAASDMADRLADPGSASTFTRCKLDPAERDAGTAATRLHRDLLALRRDDPVIAAQGADGLDGAVLGDETFCLRWSGPGGRDRLLVVNLGPRLDAASIAEPLIAPPEAAGWRLVWSSEDPRYGGAGTPAPDDDGALRAPAHAALLLAPAEVSGG